MPSARRLFSEIATVRRLLPRPYFSRWMHGLARRLITVLRKRSLGPVDDFLGEQFSLRTNGRTLELVGASFGVVREIFGRQAYIASSELSGAHRIVDLGANCGIFTLYALLNAPVATVRAVEVQPELTTILESNLRHNSMAERCHVYNAMVGLPHDEWSRTFAARHPEVLPCNVAALVEECGMCDFLKCDIEGAEFQIFTDEASWLRKVRRLGLEYHGAPEKGVELGAVLRRHGFQVNRREHGAFGYLTAIRT